MTQKYRLRGCTVDAEFVCDDGYSPSHYTISDSNGDTVILSEGEFKALFEPVPDDQGLTKDNGDE